MSKKDKVLLETKVLLLKGPHKDSLPHKLTRSTLQCRGSSLKSTIDIRGETKLTNFRERAGGSGLSNPLPGQKHRQVPLFLCGFLLAPRRFTKSKSVLSINLANPVHPILAIP